ncbi:HAD family hydrolase [Haladaptatus caseinilyticus]|uniref:HAD family hydrolase n=1 Tax=Haladaptatus caseinilyticus TaxID=2993314 RepID=UPI00224A57B9|nr:HAD family phosphatase [Haladaptatus caseinilyticus]
MPRFQTVLFDMDGVLVDSESFWQQFWRDQVFAHAEIGDPGLEDVNGRNFRESLEDLAATYGLPGEPERYARQFEEAAETVYGEQVSITPGISDFFERLRDQGIDVGIVSSADWIERVIKRFDLAPIDVMVSAEHIDLPGKPEPFIYEHAAAELGVKPSACLVIEDSVNGVRAAARAGCTVIRFCQGTTVQATDTLILSPTLQTIFSKRSSNYFLRTVSA